MLSSEDARLEPPGLLMRSIAEPIRAGLSRDEVWHGPDGSLIHCWETGRLMRDKYPGLVARALAGELVSLPWKGGTENLDEPEDGKLPAKRYGSLRYLAMWQGLRGDDLNIAMQSETDLICTRINRRVTFRKITPDNCD